MQLNIENEILEVCRRLHLRNLLAAADGNVSYRVSDEEIYFTPKGRSKARLEGGELALVTVGDKVLKGIPSSERRMHLEIYRRCQKARAVVHAHPPTAIAWSVAFPDQRELPSDALSELILAVGRVPIAPYTRPGTQAMGDVLVPFLPGCRVILLARHGAVAWGEDLEEAYNGIERLEHVCQILKSAHQLGGITSLPPAEVAALKKLREELGERIL